MRANLTNVDFTNANLTAANLSGGKFLHFSYGNAAHDSLDSYLSFTTHYAPRTAIIENADFTDALLGKATVVALCKTASGTNPVTGVDTRESLMCEP